MLAELRGSPTQISQGYVQLLFLCVLAFSGKAKDVVIWRRGRAFQVEKAAGERVQKRGSELGWTAQWAAAPAGAEGWCGAGVGTVGRRSASSTDSGAGLYWLTHVTSVVSLDWAKTVLGISFKGGHVILVSDTGGFLVTVSLP